MHSLFSVSSHVFISRRGWANNRLVPTRVAMQHNLGLGGCVVVTVYMRADGDSNSILSDEQVIASTNFHYNPATEARYVTSAEIDKARSRTSRVDYALGDTLTKIKARI